MDKLENISDSLSLFPLRLSVWFYYTVWILLKESARSDHDDDLAFFDENNRRVCFYDDDDDDYGCSKKFKKIIIIATSFLRDPKGFESECFFDEHEFR